MDFVYQCAVDCSFPLTYLLRPWPAIGCSADLAGLSFGLQEAGQVGRREHSQGLIKLCTRQSENITHPANMNQHESTTTVCGIMSDEPGAGDAAWCVQKHTQAVNAEAARNNPSDRRWRPEPKLGAWWAPQEISGPKDIFIVPW